MPGRIAAKICENSVTISRQGEWQHTDAEKSVAVACKGDWQRQYLVKMSQLHARPNASPYV
jgi:hypothetical protein